MKQSIRLIRATLYFKFIAFRDLTSVRAGATPQRMFEKRKRHGETDVKVLPWSQCFFLIFLPPQPLPSPVPELSFFPAPYRG